MINEREYIYTVYKEKSFSKAAKKLYISQPALSAIVKKVEKRIGYLLFDRETIPLTVTKEGEYYIKCVENILEIENNMEKYFEDLGKLDSGNIVIGASSFFCAFILPKLIEKFKEKYPKVDVEVIEGNIKELKEGLENNSIDLILEVAISQEDEKLKTYFYKNEHILLAVPAKWEINNKLKDYKLTSEDIRAKKHLDSSIKEISLKEFKDLPFITMKKEHDLYIRGLTLCKKVGFIPKSIYKIDQMMTGYHIALFNENAVIFIRDLLIINEQRSENLVYYKLDSELSTRPIYFVTKKNKYLSRVCKEFLKIALEKENV